MVERLEILDVPVDALSGIEEAVARVEDFMRNEAGPCRAILAVNPEKVMAARKNPALLGVLKSAGLLVPDGIGVVLAARRAGYRQVGRVPGVELMEALCARAAARGWPVFLLGATPEVSDAAARALRSRYPELRLAGRRDGYFGEQDEAAIVAEINASGAELLFVGLGSPRQELWMSRHLAALSAQACQGIGGSLDVIAGNVKRAPALVRRLNLEWLYRLLREPRRLVRQTALPRFIWAFGRRALANRFSSKNAS